MASKSNKFLQSIRPSRFFWGLFIVVMVPTFYFTLPDFFAVNYKSASQSVVSEVESVGNYSEKEKEILKPKTLHIATPEAVKGVYMTSCVAGTPSLRDGLVSFVEKTELNSIIIDIKDYSGTLSFKPEDQDLLPAWENSRCGNSAMKEFIKELHQKQIYVIGRITVFQDPHLAKRRPDLAVKKASDGSIWKDYKGLNFTDPGARQVWDYHVKLSKESFDIGFDELNFDYIRFPSDGPMKDIYFSFSDGRAKADVLEEFFQYLHQELKKPEVFGSKPPVLSADLFGMTATNIDDLNIGQVLERAFPYFDYIAPMVYPSHYPKTWNGFSNPNHYPYEVVNIAMTEAVRRAVSTNTPVKTLNNKPIYNEVLEFDTVKQATTTKSVFSGLYEKTPYDPNIMRPWLQDFKYGGDYTPADIKAQIQATYDAGLNSWIFWDPANKYESLRQILKSAS